MRLTKDPLDGLNVARFLARVPTARMREGRIEFFQGSYLVQATTNDGVTHVALLDVRSVCEMLLSFACRGHVVISTAEGPNLVIDRLAAPGPLTCLQCLARDQ